MNRIKYNPMWVVTTCLMLWSIILLMLATPQISGPNNIILSLLPLVLFFAIILSFASFFILVFGLSKRTSANEKYDRSPHAKILAILVIGTLITSTYTAIKSLWIDPSYDKFAYENISAGTAFSALVLIIILSAFQNDIYWFTKRIMLKLDERQMQVRQQVFEKSYRIGATIIILIAFILPNYFHNIPTIIRDNYNTVPGHLTLPLFNLALTFVALPLIVAAWRKK